MIQGDSFKILPTLEDKSVDLVLTDPPYDFSQDQKEFIHNHLVRIAKSWIIVFGPPENQWLPPDQYGFWIKPISTKNTSKSYSRFIEMIFFYELENRIWNSERHWSQYTNVFTDLVDNSSLHPYRKPPSLIERLVRNHSNKGDLILDPFAGSGTVEEVCQRLERRCMAIEIK